MRRFAGRDRILGVALLLIWATCLGLGIESLWRGPGLSSITVTGAESPDAYPTFTEYRPWYPGPDPGLRSGDRLIQVGDTDLRGRGAVGFALAVADEGRRGTVAVTYVRAMRRTRTTLRVGGWAMPWPALAASFVMGVTMAIALFRAAPTQLTRAGFYCMITAAIWLTSRFGGPPALTLASFAVSVVSVGLLLPLTLRACLLFPHGVPPESRWARYGPWVFVAQGPLANASTLQVWLPPDVADVLAYAVGAFFAVLVVAFMAAAWRRADPVERRQIKWVVWGVYMTSLPIASTGIAAAIWPHLGYLYFISLGAFAWLPLAVLVATFRYDLFDIDRLISATASYNLLAIVLIGAGLVLVPRAAEAAAAWIGVPPATGQIALSLMLAAAVVPAHARLRPRIEQLFFRERATLHHGMSALLDDLSACADPGALLGRFGEGVAQLFRPATSAVYAPVEGDLWQPVWSQGAAVPPAFPRDSAWVRALGRRRRPLDLTDRHREIEAGALERAALDTLDAEVVVPVRRGDAAAAFLCLGPQRSGDIYTPADLALLAAAADKVSSQMLGFDQAEILREEREMQSHLRRYVPGAVVDTLARREALEDGEREISVLFCDIRGYTAYSEARGAAEVFSAISRYTEVASEVVRARGGSVVEFLGDGLMAVFGAPDAMPDKEAAAVAVGREIVSAVERLASAAPDGEAGLAVGVGVATGTSFVGSIRAADRAIWTAIGNPVNLASRLQSLTRELDAAIAIDGATRDAAGAAASGFERRRGVKVKGRSAPLDVWVVAHGAPS